MGGMDEQHIERMPAEEVQGWLPYYAKVEFEGRGFPVAHILPPEYECYLRLFHPLSLSSGGVLSDPRTWRSVAEDAGLTFHGELEWNSLRPHVGATVQRVPGQFMAFLTPRSDGTSAGGSIVVAPGTAEPAPAGPASVSDTSTRWPLEGTIGEPARSRLFALLAEETTGQQVFFYYGIGAMSVVGRGFLFRAPANAIEAVQLLANDDVTPRPFPIPGPEYVWPVDRSWMVMIDYDLVSTYIGCNADLAERLLEDDTLELLPVTLQTRLVY
jgi:hypothetical protein